MATYNQSNVFSNGITADGGNVNTEIENLGASVNSITNDQISTTAAIAISKTEIGTYTAWGAWVPTFTASAGTPTTVTINLARWWRLAKEVKFRLNITITNKGTASGVLYFDLPATAKDNSWGGSGSEVTVSGIALIVQGNTTATGQVVGPAGVTPWVNTYVLQIQGSYEVS